MNGAVDKDLQLLAYGWGLKQALYPEVQEVLLRLHFLRYGKEREVMLESQDLAEVPDKLEARIKTIEADKDYDPTPGSFCGMCGVTAHCPVMSQALAPVAIVAPATKEDAEKAASILLTLQQMEKELAARLKEWVKANGPVSVGDMTYGLNQVAFYEFDPQLVTKTLIEAGLRREEIWPLLSISKTNLERGLRKLGRGNLLDLVLPTGTVKLAERVEFRKKSL